MVVGWAQMGSIGSEDLGVRLEDTEGVRGEDKRWDQRIGIGNWNWGVWVGA